jgi:hypothetical protein
VPIEEEEVGLSYLRTFTVKYRILRTYIEVFSVKSYFSVKSTDMGGLMYVEH